ncbi:hypothetical protein MOPEL_036_00030 [Mobilicoccus pelagius NBRC 104925]|uniref:Uncharacterized protein n=1 Tax=Mobilicoccus pelagius NBRC 104925 TaxID=1089455 RepID=H5UQN1_9MICO|nr:hypothetical protein MOPEL_036_00030 [Mobilicoccus pelagius NBRC 104925]
MHELAAEGEAFPQAGAEASHGEAHAHAHAHARGEECAAGHCSHPHHAWTSVSVDSPLPTSPRALVAFLETRAAGVHRVKGRT